jgi:hypothetical protein
MTAQISRWNGQQTQHHSSSLTLVHILHTVASRTVAGQRPLDISKHTRAAAE